MAYPPSRREFIGGLGAVALAGCGHSSAGEPPPVAASGNTAGDPAAGGNSTASAAGTPASHQPTAPSGSGIPERPLGRTGRSVSMLGLGGYHIGIPSEAEALRIMDRAIDEGVTFFDNCWDYHDGESERRMGKALQGGKRQRVFLMTKLDGRTKSSAREQLEQSLSRLRTDHIDLVQIHEVIREKDPEWVFGPDGAVAALVEAQKAGKLRYIGFTGHKDPKIHLDMLRVAEQNGFRFDTVQMPLNVLDPHYHSFEKEVLPKLTSGGIGVLGMKPLASGAALKAEGVGAVDCLHYAMNLPTAVVITGCDSMPILEQAITAARTFQPLSPDRVQALLAKTRPYGQKGELEAFKTSDKFDATSRNQQWLTTAEI